MADAKLFRAENNLLNSALSDLVNGLGTPRQVAMSAMKQGGSTGNMKTCGSESVHSTYGNMSFPGAGVQSGTKTSVAGNSWFFEQPLQTTNAANLPNPTNLNCSSQGNSSVGSSAEFDQASWGSKNAQPMRNLTSALDTLYMDSSREKTVLPDKLSHSAFSILKAHQDDLNLGEMFTGSSLPSKNTPNTQIGQSNSHPPPKSSNVDVFDNLFDAQPTSTAAHSSNDNIQNEPLAYSTPSAGTTPAAVDLLSLFDTPVVNSSESEDSLFPFDTAGFPPPPETAPVASTNVQQAFPDPLAETFYSTASDFAAPDQPVLDIFDACMVNSHLQPATQAPAESLIPDFLQGGVVGSQVSSPSHSLPNPSIHLEAFFAGANESKPPPPRSMNGHDSTSADIFETAAKNNPVADPLASTAPDCLAEMFQTSNSVPNDATTIFSTAGNEFGDFFSIPTYQTVADEDKASAAKVDDHTTSSFAADSIESLFSCPTPNAVVPPAASTSSPFEDLFQSTAAATPGPSMGTSSDGNLDILSNLGFGDMSTSAYGCQPSSSGGLQGSHVESLGVSWDDAEDEGISCGEDEVGQEGEPEVRAQLRAARLARRKARIQAARSEVRAREVEQQRQSQAREEAEEQRGEALRAWAYKNKGNIRALLGSMDQVLWAENNWKPMSMTDLISPNDVKKGYRKALLVIHPDKVKQNPDSTPEKMYIADVVFDELKEAWGMFESKEMR